MRKSGVSHNKKSSRYHHAATASQTPSPKQCSEVWRIHALSCFVFILILILGVRFFVLQVSSYQKYNNLADGQHLLSEEINPERGEIYLRDESGLYPLAVNKSMSLVYLVPKEVQDRNAVIYQLSDALQIDKSIIEEKLKRENGKFEVVKRKLSDDESAKVEALRLKGVHLEPETYRYYPGGEIASQVVGFVGFDKEKVSGRYGIEAYLNDKLEGHSGSVVQEKDAGGRWIPIADRELNPAQDGAGVVLTIRREIQYEVEKILRESIELYQADSGTVVVMDPKTGDILSMASFPQFNPNEYSKADMSSFVNPAVSLPYESGSVIKAITVAIGLEDGKIEPQTTYVDTGAVNEGGYEIRNAEDKVYGLQTMTYALSESINTGMIYIERLVGNRKFSDYFKRFGFGDKTGIELPAELAGSVRNIEDFKNNVQFYTASFGQGVTATPLQIISAYAALANGGVLMKPHIVDKYILSDGSEEDVPPQEIRRVVREDTSRKIGIMLRDVVVNGHGKRADIPGYLVVGKTGTAQVAKTDGAGYEEGKSIGSFVGYAPLDDPKYVVLVKLVDPKNVEWAESSAAPTFGRVMKFLLEYGKVKPTEQAVVKK